MLTNISKCVVKVRLAVGNQPTHEVCKDFAQTQGPSPLSVAQSVPNERGLPLGLKGLAEVINVTEPHKALCGCGNWHLAGVHSL